VSGFAQITAVSPANIQAGVKRHASISDRTFCECSVGWLGFGESRRPPPGQPDQRYYDKDARDYHEWNQNENQVYHQYVTENHKRDREFAKTTRTEKKDYFKWRHEHPDQDKH
jgi:hypothetical protein